MFTNSNGQTKKFKFIVVYDKFTEPIAQSLFKRASVKQIKCILWNEVEYKHKKAALTNFEYLVILSKKIIKKNFADPTLKQNQIVQGVLYKSQGHQIGIYIDKNADVIKTADFLGQVYKENWSNVTMGFVGQGVILGLSLFAIILSIYEKKRAKFYLLMKAIDEFDKKFMLEYVQDKL